MALGAIIVVIALIAANAIGAFNFAGFVLCLACIIGGIAIIEKA